MLGETPLTLVNRAIQLFGDDQPPVTGTYPDFDSSPAGVAAAQLYLPCVQTVAKRWGWDYARSVVALVLTGNTAPYGIAYEYAYPTNGIEIGDLFPAAPDPNNPLPVNHTVGNVMVAGVPTKVIWTNLQNANASMTAQPPPALWDADFAESVVRLLASEMAMAIAGRPQTGSQLIGEADSFATAAEGRPG
jgi:hypothetical protein